MIPVDFSGLTGESGQKKGRRFDPRIKKQHQGLEFSIGRLKISF